MEYAAPKPQFDPARVTGWATAIACNLLVLALLARGAGDPWSAPGVDEPARTPIDWIIPVIPPPPPPPEQVPEVRRAPQPVAAARTPAPPLVAPEPSPMAVPAPQVDPGIDAVPAADTGPALGNHDGAGASDDLGYVEAPAPRYPAEALRRGWQGTVWLKVLVDEYGRPVEVEIERSSGHGSLDRAARQQVRDRWRFQPAVRDGRPVPAWGRVPISFSLGAG